MSEAGSSESGIDRIAGQIWTRFRASRGWVQALGWLALWPALLAVLMLRRPDSDTGVKVVAAGLVMLNAFWLTAPFTGGAEDAAPPDAGSGEHAAAVATPTAERSGEPTPTSEPASESPTPTPTPSATASSPDPSPSPTPAVEAFEVSGVTDGDTLKLDGPDGVVTVRLAQVDAPETPNECFSSDATAALRELVAGATLTLRRPGPPFEDDFGRALGELVTATGTSINVELVRRGFAAWGSDFASEDPDLAGRMRTAQDEAQAQGRGIWSTCGGPHIVAAPDRAEEPPSAPPSQGTPAAAQPAASVPFGGTSCHPAYDPCVPPVTEVGDLDCGDIRSVYPGGVRVDHAHGDPHRLDGNDDDGRGCE